MKIDNELQAIDIFDGSIIKINKFQYKKTNSATGKDYPKDKQWSCLVTKSDSHLEVGLGDSPSSALLSAYKNAKV